MSEGMDWFHLTDPGPMTKVTRMIACLPRRARSRRARSSTVVLTLLTLAALLGTATAQAPPVSPLAGEGAKAHRADWVSSTYHVEGAGVTVCVLSDSIDNGQGAIAAARRVHALPQEPPLPQERR
jgi:hypothetical protein